MPSGWVLAVGTPRYVTADRARRLAESAPIPGFLVTVDQTPQDLIDLAEANRRGGSPAPWKTPGRGRRGGGSARSDGAPSGQGGR